MDALFLVGRFLFGLLFVVSGLAGHLAGYRQLAGYAAAKKIPFAGPAVLVSGVMIILGGIGIIAGARVLRGDGVRRRVRAFGDRAAVRPVAAVACDAATWRSRPGRADVASGRS